MVSRCFEEFTERFDLDLKLVLVGLGVRLVQDFCLETEPTFRVASDAYDLSKLVMGRDVL